MKEKTEYLECEKEWVYWFLIIVGGWYGAYTFAVRGGVFCNAQTANVVLFCMALGQRNWSRAAYLLLPISSYFFGAFLSEWMGKTVKKLHLLRWDTILIGIEIAVVIFLGLLPAEAPDQICQVALNFICSMQFNTFRQVEGVPAASTFVTNHIRQIGSNLAKYIRHRDDAMARRRLHVHGTLILFFMAGAVASTICCEIVHYQAIWGALVFLLILFFRLMRADLTYEKDSMNKVPHGH